MRALLVVMLACGLCAPAVADERDDAKREFGAGQQADKQKDYHVAIEHYLRAYELVPHPFALFNIAADYEQLGDLKQAVHFYEKYISETQDPADRERVKRILNDLKARPGAVTIHTSPDGARLVIDGKEQGTTPFSGMLRGGRHVIVVEYEGQRQQRDLYVELGQPVEELIRFGAQQGMIQVSGTPVGAPVYIDNVPVGVLPARVPEPAGEHQVRVMQMGFAPFETTAMVQPGSTTDVHAELVKGDSIDLPGATKPAILLYYLFGTTGGADVRGNGGYFGFDLGVHSPRADFLVSLGRTGEGSSIDAQFRYFFADWRFAPFLGVGYSYVQQGPGYELTGGVRYDLLRGPKFGVGLLAQFALRIYAGHEDDSGTNPMTTDAGVFMPITATVQVFWR